MPKRDQEKTGERTTDGCAVNILKAYGCLEPFRSAVLRSTMLQPQDDDARSEMLETFAVQAASTLLLQSSKQRVDTEDPRLPLSVASVIDTWVQRNARVSNPAPNNTWRGTCAGDILRWIVQIHKHAPPACVNKAAAIVEDDLKGVTAANGSSGPQSPREIRKSWKVYKPVAHLWAAFRVLQFREGNESARNSDALASFIADSTAGYLALAQGFLLFGTTFRSHGQEKPLLELSDAWHFPAGAHKPIQFTIPPLEDWASKILENNKAPQRSLHG